MYPVFRAFSAFHLTLPFKSSCQKSTLYTSSLAHAQKNFTRASFTRDLGHITAYHSASQDSVAPASTVPTCAPPPVDAKSAGGSSRLTVVELFQSQGCDMCPPANDNVITLTDDTDKLVLTYEVTYWNHLGWDDTFASKDWDERQRDYSFAFNSTYVYTPQVIVNGLSSGVGSKMDELTTLIRGGKASPHAATVDVQVQDEQVVVSGPTGARGLVQVIQYDPRNHIVKIPRGENVGRTLPHRNVVRGLTKLGWWEGGESSFKLPKLEDENYKAAIIVQKQRGGPIMGAAKV